ncbi:serine carboxypeptidase-like 51 [Nymphaea colorata]|nr:serine carboxypeptidase-like 51 [Nymphaea colorata]XP_031485822.1 serine carboxypeptidase-like 51 [Nymphaea colorata]
MEKKTAVILAVEFFCLLLPCFHGGLVGAVGTDDKMEEWGYVEVRPKAHMFWWLYRSPYRVQNSTAPWPIVLWLQGGPGSSGVGLGNFKEIGPLDTNLKPRNSTWLRKADLLFVDSPVGTGYSFVEEQDLAVKTDEEAATDLTTLLIKLFNNNESLQSSPLYVVAESYGGKHAATLGLAVYDAIQAGKLKMKLGGVSLGDSWISPEDFVLSWGPLLKDVSRLDLKTAEEAIRRAADIQETLSKGQYMDAVSLWSDLENFVVSGSNNVDLYNFLLDFDNDPVTAATTDTLTTASRERYMRYLEEKHGSLSDFMNTVVRKKLEIIPENIQWGGQADIVFNSLSGDFMKPRINEVDELLTRGVQVTIYNGQLDLICSTKGTEAWVQKLKWKGLNDFNSSNRTALYCDQGDPTKGFYKSNQNLHFYWILGAGHFVPLDQPCIALKMIGDITHSPAS